MTIERVQPDDRLSAARENELADQLNAMSRPGSTIRAQFGSPGLTFDVAAGPLVELFELTGYTACEFAAVP